MKCDLLYTAIITAAFSLLPASCMEEEPDGGGLLPEGSSMVNAAVEFKPMEAALDGGRTRTAGDAIREIEDLNVILYSVDGQGRTAYFDCLYYGPGSYEILEVDRTGMADAAERRTQQATFRMHIPNGCYKMYVAANMGSGFAANYPGITDPTTGEAGLKSISLTWNASDIAANNQMFGYFKTDSAIPSETDKYTAETITVGSDMNLHAWIRRAASKVTLAFDGSRLNDNVYIFINSAQIKDIPRTCLLGSNNTPTGTGQLAQGETLDYNPDGAGYEVTEHPVCISNGNPYYPVAAAERHAETSAALYFFENMQGTGKDKRQDADGDGNLDAPGRDRPKDHALGTYIEVNGYYVNRSGDDPARGPITYRFMLGKDERRSYDAERNYHYKLTLRFNKEANDADWHIDYTPPEPPTIQTPDVMYISYLDNEMLTIPVVCRGMPDGTQVTATIIENQWTGDLHHPYYTNAYSDDQIIACGFLLFDMGAPQTNQAGRKAEFNAHSSKTYSVSGEKCSNVNVWTRHLSMGSSFSGNNIDFHYPREATVRFQAYVNGKNCTKDVKIIQIPRIENPVGVWRRHDSTKEFTVDLKYQDENGTHYTSVISDGPWTASVSSLCTDWVEIQDLETGSWGNEVRGHTGSRIRFKYRPKSTIASNVYRSGVITVSFHNNTCRHYILVSQGTGRINIGGTSWHTCNFEKDNADVANPLLEGSMFVCGNTTGLAAENNRIEYYGISYVDSPYYTCTDGVSRKFEDLAVDLTGFSTLNVATKAQWDNLDANTHNLYGILYGDESDGVQADIENAARYQQPGQARGMRGLFRIVPGNAQSLFFPISNSGYGRLKYHDDCQNVDRPGTVYDPARMVVLRYANRFVEMPEATARVVPNYYDIYRRPGVIYWYKQRVGTNNNDYCYSHDINYYTYLVGSFQGNGIYTTSGRSDAFFIRRTGD